MALIKCPECGKEISDKAGACPHCGCPNIQKNHCIINGVDVDCSFVFNNYDIELRQMEMMDKTNLDVEVADKIVEEWSSKGIIPPVFNGKTSTWEDEVKNNSNPTQSNIPKCPTCGSTNLSKVSTMSKAGSVFMWGLLSQKVKKTWHCNNCKYEW